MKKISKCKKVIIAVLLIPLLLFVLIISRFITPKITYLFQDENPISMPENIDTSKDMEVAKLRANLYDKATGYCEEEADELRQEILHSKNTLDLYEANGRIYYMSSSEGNDQNDGLSPETPFKTLTGLHSAYTVDGDTVLFKRGDTFRFGDSLFTYSGLTYGAYGEGEKPKIYGSPENYAQSNQWKQHSKNVWKIPFDYPEACGLVINHSELVGVKRTKIITLLKNGDYYHDVPNGVFYLYSDQGKPSNIYKDIEIMPSFSIIDAIGGSANVTIDNLCLKYSSAFAIHAVNALNFTITNCEIGFIGGKYTKNGSLRYGNAIEFWEGAEDVMVENNWIYQTFDSALTWQGKIGKKYINISFSNNLFEYNNADIEFFETDAYLSNFIIKNNIMRFTSMGWGTRAYDGGIRGIEGCIRGVTGSHPRNKSTTVESAYFTDNIIDCPARQIINWSWEPEQSEVIHASGTRLYIKSEYRTLDKCLQGLQTKKGESYYKRTSTNSEELKKYFEIFEKDAEIYWDK